MKTIKEGFNQYYTGLGIQVLTIGLACASILFLLRAELTHAAPPADFQTSLIVGSGLSNPTGFDIAPDGRIFILQQSGQVYIYKNGQLLAQPFATLPTSLAGGDLGLLGIAFDPDFYLNHYVYFYYTSDDLHNTVIRYDASGDVATGNTFFVYESETVTQQFHAGGTIAFGQDKKLYLSIGDNQYRANAQDLSNPQGKILRINRDGTIPQDNPFVGQAGKLPEIWAYGLRNPFRFQFDSATGALYLGDVGERDWEEINVITKGANYGWPVCEGICAVNGMTNPLYAYNHANLSSSVTGGFVYHGATFPSSYQGTYFFADYARGFMRTLSLDAGGNLTGNSDFDLNVGAVVDMKQAPDGSIYYLTIFPGRLYQTTYASGNHVPVAKSGANPTHGDTPLDVTFSSAGSQDSDGTPLIYNWDFGDGSTSTDSDPTKVYNTPGAYTVVLKVSDGVFQTQAIPLSIQVGTPPTVTITSPVQGSLYKAGDTISYAATATDSNGQTLPASSFTTEVTFHHDTHVHPFLGPVAGTSSGQFTIPTFGENSTNTWYEIKITASDADGLSTSASVTIFPQIVNLTFQTTPGNLKIIFDSQTINTPAIVESVVGFKREIDVPAMQLLNSTYYQFDSWSDGGGLKHFLTTPNTNTTITAVLKPTPPFNASYYNNSTLTGTPVLTRNEGPIDFDYGSGSPTPGVNSDNFSARFVKQHYFNTGTYKFETASDDGVRLYIDGTILIDKWVDQASTPYSATIALTEGNHEIKLEYYEHGGGASVRLTWDQTTGSTPPPPPPPPTGQYVASFSLINADTNQVVATFDPFTNGANINLATLPTRNLNIRANTNPATTGSVRFGYDGTANFQTESYAPYALASDNDGDYLPWTPTVGSHTVTATPYTGAGGSGTLGTPLSLNFTITDSGNPPPPPSGPSVTSFSLINADTNQVIVGFDSLTEGAILNLATLPTRNLNIRANTSPAIVGSVKFGYDANASIQTESYAPYALASDNDGDYLPWTPSVGSHTVIATPYTGAGGTGTAGTALSITFTVSDSGNPPPPPPPTGQSITSFSLINADTDQVIATFDPIQNGTTISLASLPTANLNMRANTNPATVGSVQFGLDGVANVRVESYAPYALASDNDGDYLPWTPNVGSHTVTATPYTGANGVGSTGTPLSITFTVTQ